MTDLMLKGACHRTQCIDRSNRIGLLGDYKPEGVANGISIGVRGAALADGKEHLPAQALVGGPGTGLVLPVCAAL